MAHEITLVNGVSKQEVNGNLVYFFPLALIHAYTDATPANEYYLLQLYNGQQIQRVNYSDITDKLLSTTLTGYLDTCATNGYWS
jgi:hypothetical protein